MKKVSMNGKKIDYKKNTVISQVSPKNKKQFQLFYRQRDGSAPQNQFQSIIFVKSKRCKPDSSLNCFKSHNKKNKVNEQFKKIMKEMDNHLKQNDNKSEKEVQPIFNSKQISSAKPSLKTTGLSKNKVKQNDENIKPKKLTERSIGKHQKKINNFIDSESQNFTSKKVVSPKKINTSIKSPKGKIKQIENKNQTKIKVTQKGDQNISTRLMKSPLKTRINFKQKQKNYNFPLNNSPKSKNKSSYLHKKSQLNSIQNQNLTQQKAESQHRLNLNQQQYIFLDGQIVQTNDQSLFQLQNRLLSTYRVYDTKQHNPCSDSYETYQNYVGFLENKNIANQAIITDRVDQEQQESVVTSKMCSKSNSQIQLKVVRLFLIKKVIFIQKWWRAMLSKEKIKNQNIKLCLNKGLNLGKVKKCQIKTEESELSNQIIKSETPLNLQCPHFPSEQSIAFGTPLKQNSTSKNYIGQQFTLTQRSNLNSSEITLIAERQTAASDQKMAHQEIIQNLLCENKISLDCYNQKMTEIQQEYQKQLEQIEKMRQFLTKNAQKVFNLKNKILQDKKLASNITSQKDQQLLSKIFGKKQNHILQDFKQKQSNQEKQQIEVQIKKYHIGGSFTSNTINSNGAQNQLIISSKYKKRTNQKGDEYYQDFQEQIQNEEMKIEESQFSIQSIPEGFHPHFVMNTNFTQLLEEYKQQQIVKNQIDTRIAYQMGAIQQIPQTFHSQKNIKSIKESQKTSKIKVDTSIIGIHKFLNNFFNFYAYYYKDDFLRLVNMPYGYQPQKRISFIQGYQDTSDEVQQDQDGILYGLQFVMPDEALQDYCDQFYSQAIEKYDKNSYERQILECEKVHNRAIFDSFNQALNNFRPYYGINGPPYPWTNSQKALTFYFIAQQNIQQVFQKTQFKVLRNASALLGINIEKYQNQEKLQTDELQEVLNYYKKSTHPIILQNRQQRLAKQEKMQVLDSIFKWSTFQQQKCGLLIQITSLIFQQLAEQVSIQMHITKRQHKSKYRFQQSQSETSQFYPSQDQRQNKKQKQFFSNENQNQNQNYNDIQRQRQNCNQIKQKQQSILICQQLNQ